jgi:hypothetical protein
VYLPSSFTAGVVAAAPAATDAMAKVTIDMPVKFRMGILQDKIPRVQVV